MQTANANTGVVTGLRPLYDSNSGHFMVQVTNSGLGGNVRAHTSNGHIRAERVEGSFKANTFEQRRERRHRERDKPVGIDTSNSGVDLTLPPNFSASVHIDTRNAPITLRLAAGTNARVSARTSNSSIDTEFEVRARGELSRNRLDGVIGNGGPLNST